MSDPHAASLRPLPSAMDWLLVAINTAFVAAGGLVTIAFFGSCLAVAAGTFWRKLRYRRFAGERIDVAGGVPIRPSRTFLPLLGGWLAVLGVVLFVFGGEIGLIFQGIAVIIAVSGMTVLVLALTGYATGAFDDRAAELARSMACTPSMGRYRERAGRRVRVEPDVARDGG